MIKTMKLIHIILILIIFSIFVSAKEATFTPKSSFVIDNKNITLIRFDTAYGNALFCVNGIKDIIKEDESKNINEVFIDIFDIGANEVITDIVYKCRDCICEEDCDNSICFREKEKIIEKQQETQGKEENITLDYEEKIITPVTINHSAIIIAILIIIAALLGLIVLWKKI